MMTASMCKPHGDSLDFSADKVQQRILDGFRIKLEQKNGQYLATRHSKIWFDTNCSDREQAYQEVVRELKLRYLYPLSLEEIHADPITGTKTGLMLQASLLQYGSDLAVYLRVSYKLFSELNFIFRKPALTPKSAELKKGYSQGFYLYWNKFSVRMDKSGDIAFKNHKSLQPYVDITVEDLAKKLVA